jgi:hypothetical protein
MRRFDQKRAHQVSAAGALAKTRTVGGVANALPGGSSNVIHVTNFASDAFSARPPLAAASKKIVFQQ